MEVSPSDFPLASNILGYLSESQWSMTESHAVLERQLPPPTQEISTLDRNLGKTGTDGRHSVNASLSMPIPGTVLQVDQQLPPIIEMHTPDYDLEKSSDSDEKASACVDGSVRIKVSPQNAISEQSTEIFLSLVFSPKRKSL